MSESIPRSSTKSAVSEISSRLRSVKFLDLLSNLIRSCLFLCDRHRIHLFSGLPLPGEGFLEQFPNLWAASSFSWGTSPMIFYETTCKGDVWN